MSEFNYGDNVEHLLYELSQYYEDEIKGSFEIRGEDESGVEGYEYIEVSLLADDAFKLIAELKAERDALAASFDELAKAVGWTVEQCEQTGESPMDVALSLVNLVSELENDASTAGQIEELAGAMLNRTLDSGSKQAVAYAECADMVARFAAQLRAGEPS